MVLVLALENKQYMITISRTLKILLNLMMLPFAWIGNHKNDTSAVAACCYVLNHKSEMVVLRTMLWPPCLHRNI